MDALSQGHNMGNSKRQVSPGFQQIHGKGKRGRRNYYSLKGTYETCLSNTMGCSCLDFDSKKPSAESYYWDNQGSLHTVWTVDIKELVLISSAGIIKLHCVPSWSFQCSCKTNTRNMTSFCQKPKSMYGCIFTHTKKVWNDIPKY